MTMKIGAGLNVSKPLAEVVYDAKRLSDLGFASLASSHIFGYDALSLLGHIGAAVPEVELATAVVPIYTRHPIAMAQQALTVQAMTGGRLVLGIGLSHEVVIEHMYGLSFGKPLRAMREYLAVLMPLLGGERVSFEGETLQVSAGPIDVAVPLPPPVIVAALGPAMLRLAGEVADGTATWMTGVRTLRDHIVPTIRQAADGAGRPAPRVMCALPVAVTDDPGAVRARANEVFAIYGQLPSYRAMLDREGVDGPGDVAIVGSEQEVRSKLGELEDAGVTDFSMAPVGSRPDIERTMDFFAGLSAGE
jgi:5,10-methylenetetrahydromethanopterin reductase